MCNFSEGVYQRGFEEGVTKSTLASIKNIMKNMNATADQAMNLLKIADSEKPKYLELLQQE